MPVEAQTIRDYWRSSELNAIADYNQDALADDAVIEVSINDAYAELEPLTDILSTSILDLYAKRLTICNLLSRLNIGADAVELPLKDCKEVKEMITNVLKDKVKAMSATKAGTAITGVQISDGETELKDNLRNF
jgi:alanine-alpha-ketoisovalerate/valine-pyruvate aminotransferase